MVLRRHDIVHISMLSAHAVKGCMNSCTAVKPPFSWWPAAVTLKVAGGDVLLWEKLLGVAKQ